MLLIILEINLHFQLYKPSNKANKCGQAILETESETKSWLL